MLLLYNEVMNYEDEMIKNKLFDLANRSYQKNINCNSKFLNLHEQEIFITHKNSLSYANPFLFGGREICERKIVFFNDDLFLHKISCLKVTAKNKKFADKLTHRDFLGAILNLGIEYNLIGDIFVENNTAYIFCLTEISNYIIENLTKVKHTQIQLEKIDINNLNLKKNYKIKTISVSSLRIDAIISKIYNLDRETSKDLIVKGLVNINDAVNKNTSKTLKEQDIVSVRGYGKLKIDEITIINNKPHINIQIYV